MQELLAKLISFKTTADRPEEIKKGFEYIASLFDSPSSAGFKKFDVQMLEKNDKYSLLVSFKGKDALRSKILLNGHFDVVPEENEDQFKMKVEGTKAFGRGTKDMKGMVVAMIEVMQELGNQSNPPDVTLLLNGDEEVGGMDGAGYMAREVGLRPEFVVCPDGRCVESLELITKGKGVLWIELTAKGVEAHGAYTWKGENAIDKLTEAVQKVKQLMGPVEPDAWKTTVNLGVIETSNKTPNKVPGDAKAILDIRFTEAMAKTPEELRQKIQNVIPEISLRVLEACPLFSVDESSPLLMKFKKVAEEILGVPVPFTYAHGATDIRYFAELGIPGALYGAVGENAHAAGEWVDLESLEKNKEILFKFLS